MPFVDIPNNDIKIVAMKLNNRPRKTLNYKTPNEVFYDNSNKNSVALIT